MTNETQITRIAGVRADRPTFVANAEDRILFKFDKPEDAKPWQTVNDGVMGGRSVGRFSYRQSFKTKKGEWIEVQLPVDKSGATWRGRVFPNEKLDPSKVTGLGFLLGDKKAGPFKLEVEWIKVSKSPPPTAKADSD